jgi:hypothetical protein
LKPRSVTSRSQEMKRPAPAWQEKVDEYCRSYLEVYPEICRLLAQLPESIVLPLNVQSLSSTSEVFKQIKEISRQRPELRKTKSIRLKPEFVRMMEEVPSLKGMVEVGEQEYPAWFAKILGPMQQLALFPGLTPEMKMDAYLLLAFYYAALKYLFGTMRRMQYGAEPLDTTKVFTLAGQFFEMLAQACRGRPTQNKGRYNLELIGLVKMIQEHQTEKMSPGEMREALAAAGVSVPEGETWRIWLWRARKDGLIASGSAAPTARSKKPL